MNFKLVFRICGSALLLEGIAMIIPMVVSLLYKEDPMPFIKSIVILIVIGILLIRFLKPDQSFYSREGFFTVGLIWVLFSVFGALPFWFSGQVGSYVDCLFETISGFTTTGATILTEIEGLPYGLLFWRSLTHWLGGMGVLILATALFPSFGISSTYLIRAESPGPISSKLVPKASNSSQILYAIYSCLTLAEVVLLRITGLPWYDSFIHAMSTAGTGGFSSRNLSVGSYGNPAAEVVIIIFMLLFSLNFSIYFMAMCGKFRDILKSDELRFFLCVVFISIVLISLNTSHLYSSLRDCIRTSAFQVVSIISTTGFTTANFDLWPAFSKMIIVLLMFIGACAGSTGGGMKCARILVLVKSVRREIRTIIHPRSVTVVKLDGKPVKEDTVRSIFAFFFTYMLIIIVAAVIVGLDNFSFGTTLSAVITCVSNVGPGLEAVGPVGNFAGLSVVSKLTLSSCMIIGRLEIFPLLVLFSRSAWKRS